MAVEAWDTYLGKAGNCCVCQKELEEKELYFGTLAEVDDEGFTRRDFCLACWKDEYRDKSFSFWQSRIPEKEEKKKLFIDNDALKQIFKRLTLDDDPDKQPFTFVLGLILMRKRLLKYLETEHCENLERWVVKLTGEDTQYRVVNPQLTDEQLNAVREQLNEVLACD